MNRAFAIRTLLNVVFLLAMMWLAAQFDSLAPAILGGLLIGAAQVFLPTKSEYSAEPTSRTNQLLLGVSLAVIIFPALALLQPPNNFLIIIFGTMILTMLVGFCVQAYREGEPE